MVLQKMIYMLYGRKRKYLHKSLLKINIIKKFIVFSVRKQARINIKASRNGRNVFKFYVPTNMRVISNIFSSILTLHILIFQCQLVYTTTCSQCYLSYYIWMCITMRCSCLWLVSYLKHQISSLLQYFFFYQ